MFEVIREVFEDIVIFNLRFEGWMGVNGNKLVGRFRRYEKGIEVEGIMYK